MNLKNHSIDDDNYLPSRTERPCERPFQEPEIVESPLDHGIPRPFVDPRPETFESPTREDFWDGPPQPGYPDEDEPGVAAQAIEPNTSNPSQQDVYKKAKGWSRRYGSKMLHRLWGYVQRTLRENKTGLLVILPSAWTDQTYPQAKYDLSNLSNSTLAQSTIDPPVIPLDESLRSPSLVAYSLISVPFNFDDASDHSSRLAGDLGVTANMSDDRDFVNQSDGESEPMSNNEARERVDISAITSLDWPQRSIVVPNDNEEEAEEDADFPVASQPQPLVVEGFPNRSTSAPDSALKDVASQPKVMDLAPDTNKSAEINDPPTPVDRTTPSSPFAPSKPMPLEPVGPLPLEPVEPLPLEPVEPLPLEPVEPLPLEPVEPLPLEPVEPQQPINVPETVPMPSPLPMLPPLPSHPEMPLSPPTVGDPDGLENNETDQSEQPPTQLPITNDRPPTDPSGTDSDGVLPDRDEPDNTNDVDSGDPIDFGANVLVDPMPLTLDASNGTQTLLVKAGQGTVVIENFTGVGRGATPSPDILSEIDTIQFEGSGLIADRLMLDQQGNDVIIRFTDVPNTTVILENVEREDLDNLPLIPEGWATPVGNILFDGDRHIIDSFDVFNADSLSGRLFERETVTFLNDLDNEVTGFNSDDTIHALDGHDSVLGYGGDDRILGGQGDDTLIGGQGDDTLLGNEGNDILIGGEGNDILIGGPGDNVLRGNAGHDQFVITPYAGVNIFQDFTDEDTLILDQALTWDDLNVVRGVNEKTGEAFTNILLKDGEQLLAVIPNRGIDLQGL